MRTIKYIFIFFALSISIKASAYTVQCPKSVQGEYSACGQVGNEVNSCLQACETNIKNCVQTHATKILRDQARKTGANNAIENGDGGNLIRTDEGSEVLSGSSTDSSAVSGACNDMKVACETACSSEIESKIQNACEQERVNAVSQGLTPHAEAIVKDRQNGIKEARSIANKCGYDMGMISIGNADAARAMNSAYGKYAGVREFITGNDGRGNKEGGFLNSTMGKGLMIGGGALGLMCVMGNCPFGGGDDDDEQVDANGDGIPDNVNHSVVEQEGGLCLENEGVRVQCYTNDQLRSMCHADNPSYQQAQLYSGGAAGSAQNAQFNQELQSQQQTAQMHVALCNKFAMDEREGGGADPNMCHRDQENFYKDQEPCVTELLAQCADTDEGDCAIFNQNYCYEDDARGEGSNYCVYKQAKEFCGSNGEGVAASPACMWLSALQSLAQSGSSCRSNLNAMECLPNDFGSQTDYQTRCDAINKPGDPVCQNLNNEKFLTVFRNPSIDQSGDVPTEDTPNGSDAIADGGGNNESIVDAPADDVDCDIPDNFMNHPSCKPYYCAQALNQASAVCQEYLNAAAPASQSAIPISYPAGEPGADVSTERGDSLLTSRAVGDELCESGQLMDCGPLEGLTQGSSSAASTSPGG